MKTPSTRRLALCLLACSVAAPLVPAATPSQSARAAHPDLSGFWQVDQGQWTVPTSARLTPGAEAAEHRAQQDIAAGRVVSYASRWCNFLGVPFIMGQSPPINIVEGPDEILVLPEQTAAARHIYLDGRAHPSVASFQPTTDGHSVGHWQGDVLVVDTTDFSTRGAIDIPGGGYRTRSSHLVERFRLGKDGKTLTIQSTWTDPTVYAAPHTYSSTYHRLPPDTYAYEDSCDASDAAPFTNSGGTRDPDEP